jgi:hypothetical protein
MWKFRLMISKFMNLVVCILQRITTLSTVQSVECQMFGWWVVNETERKYNGCHGLTGRTALIFSWTDWLEDNLVYLSQDGPLPCRLALPIECETRYRLSQRGGLHILRWREFWRFLDFCSGVSDIAVLLGYDITLLGTLFLMFWDRLILWRGRKKIIMFRSVILQRNGIFWIFFVKGEFLCLFDYILPDLLI